MVKTCDVLSSKVHLKDRKPSLMYNLVCVLFALKGLAFVPLMKPLRLLIATSSVFCHHTAVHFLSLQVMSGLVVGQVSVGSCNAVIALLWLAALLI